MTSKYMAQRTRVGDITFASKKEARRYAELKLLERAGEINNLKLQPRFPLIVEGQLVCTYVADFSYFNKDKWIIEDTKGFKTPEYKIKRKLLLALNKGMDHREV